ncbi:MAG: glutathione S-transferase family protein [Hyphomicrobiaceae bacterium]
MITLYVFGPMLGLPDPSPMCMKVHALLKIAKLDYRVDTKGFKKAPKGKLPYIDDAGAIVADSTFIRWHVEEKYGIDFDKGLSPAERAQAWAFEKLCEDNLYWANMHDRWLDDANFARGPAKFFDSVPAPLRPLIRAAMLRKVRKNLHAQGTGRHSAAEISRLAIHGIDAIAAQLGDKSWLMGSEPCGADASVHAAITSILCPTFDTPLRTAAEGHANLVAYSKKGLERWFASAAAT